jgi:hypothetical protein
VLVAHSCNPSYSGGRHQEDPGLKPACANSSQDPILKKPITHTKKGRWLTLYVLSSNPRTGKKKLKMYAVACICNSNTWGHRQRSLVERQPKLHSKILSQKNKGWVGVCLPNKHEALNLNPSTTKKAEGCSSVVDCLCKAMGSIPETPPKKIF